MASKFSYPAISLEKKTNEQNIQATKTYLNDLSDNLNYQVDSLESRLLTLEKILLSKEE